MSAEERAWAYNMLKHFREVHPGDSVVEASKGPCLHCGRLMCGDHPDKGFYDCTGPGKHEAPWQHEINEGER